VKKGKTEQFNATIEGVDWLKVMRTYYGLRSWPELEAIPTPGEELTKKLIVSDHETGMGILNTQGGSGKSLDHESCSAVLALGHYLELLQQAQEFGNTDEIIDCACRVGACWMALRERVETGKMKMVRHDRPRPGKREHPVWEYARFFYVCDPKGKKSAICLAAIHAYEKETGKKCKIEPESMESAFSKRVKNLSLIFDFGNKNNL
jgi:hypothetical protein